MRQIRLPFVPGPVRVPAEVLAAETITFPDGGVTPFKGCKLSTWEGGMRAPMVIRWPRQ